MAKNWPTAMSKRQVSHFLPTMPLPPALSPTANVRRSCRMLMKEPVVDPFLDEPSDLISTRPNVDDTHTKTSSPQQAPTAHRTVGIYSTSLTKLAVKIASQISADDESSSASPEAIEWDADGWHYTGAKYARSTSRADSYGCGCSEHEDQVEVQRVERVLLYILALDTINFCFWPTEDSSGKSVCAKNLLEYEHLASALRLTAEKDDVIAEDDVGAESADTYAFSPRNLAKTSLESFLSDIQKYLPEPTSDGGDGCYLIPNASERVRLLNELGHGLITHHDGSATAMLKKCIGPSGRPSAVKLVDIITSTFRGFRDEVVDAKGRQICFYKRAQIVVGDIWAAFAKGKTDTVGGRLTNFDDISELTTFADYRVPQLLRHVGVLRYSEELSTKVDGMEELMAGSSDELFIRAGTVVAVDRLVDEVKQTLKDNVASQGRIDKVNAVLLDWHLWQIGEKMDREGTLKPHHRVRTIFY